MGTGGQPGYVLGDFCLKQGIDFINFGFKRVIFSWTINSLRVCTTAKFLFIIVLHSVWFRVKCLKQGIKNRNSVLSRV